MLKRGPDVVPQLLTPSSTNDLQKCLNQKFVIRGLPLNMNIKYLPSVMLPLSGVIASINIKMILFFSRVPTTTQPFKDTEIITNFDDFLRWYLSDISSSTFT